MSKTAKLVLAIWIGVLLVGAGWIVWDIVAGQGAPGAASIGGSFTLTDQNGRRVTDADFTGKPAIVYFGYTYCPDACPTALEQLGAAAKDKVTVLFITVDPERDTAKVLKEYLENFGPEFIGLSGTPEEIAAAASKFRVFYRKVPGKEGAPYLMDHSSVLYVMDRRGRYVQAFTHNSRASDIAAAVAKLL
jgi:protein SCO1/2